MGYTANDIQTLDFKTAIRTRVSMYMGSADNQGVLQCIREAITNSIDEYTMGYGNRISVGVRGNTFWTRDWARGVPFLKKDDGTNVLIDIYTKPHTGGKFNDKTYASVAGQNG